VIHIDEPAHIWFGLSYASFYVMPRVVLQSAPPDLQRAFIAAAEAIHAAVEYQEPENGWAVIEKGRRGRFRKSETDLNWYDRGRRRLPLRAKP
jgi:hypothetical protein